MALVPGPRQRPHPRGDDPVPRLRRRPAADGVARRSTSGRSRSGWSDEDVYWGTRLACVEMIAHRHDLLLGHVLARRGDRAAVEDAGLRAVTAAPLIDDADPAKSARACRDAERSLERITDGRRRAGAAGLRAARDLLASPSDPCAGSPSVSAELRPAGPDPPLRDRGRGHACVAEHGVRPAALPRLGRPARARRPCSPTACWLDEAELELIAERGATVVTNPVANLKLAVGGVFPYRDGAGARGRDRAWAPTAPGRTTRSTCSPTPSCSPCCRSTRRAIPRR